MQASNIENNALPSLLLSNENRCTHEYQGLRCKAMKVHGSDFCFFHSPELEEERISASSKGGGRTEKVSRLGDEWHHQRIKGPKQIVKILGDVANLVIQGRLHPSVGNAVASLASVMLRAIEQGELERRLSVIEKQLEEMNR